MPRRRGGGRGGGADWYSKSRGRGGDAGGKGGRRGKKGGVVDDTKKQHRWQPAEAGPPGPVVLQQQPERSLLPPAASSSEDEGGGDDEEESAAAVPAPLTTRGDEGPPPSAPAGTGGADSGVEGTQLATDRAIHTGGSDPSPPRSIADLNAADTVSDALNKLSESAYECAAGDSFGLGPKVVKQIKKKHARELAALADVLSDLRNRVSLEGTARTTSTFDQPGFENAASWFHGSNANNCFVLDRFLWSAEDEDRLESVGALHRSYCTKCGTLLPFKDGVLLEQCTVANCGDGEGDGGGGGGAIVGRHWITNSLPLDQSLLIYTSILPGQQVDLKGKKVVDVGSRLGNNLVVGMLFTEAAEHVGVEIDPWFAQESQRMLNRCSSSLASTASAEAGEDVDGDEDKGGGVAAECRASVVCADIVDCPELLQSADVVIFFNPFEQLHEAAAGKRLLMLFAEQVSRPGTIVVTIPSAEDIYSRAGCVLDLIAGKTTGCVDIGTWLRPRGNHEDIFVYEVIGNGVH